MTASPFDDIQALITGLPQARAPRLAAAPALGRLGRIGAWLSQWGEAQRPRVLRPIVALYAGSYAETDTQAVRDRLEAIAAGGATINALAQAAGAGLEAFDLAVDRPVADIARRAAMSERECAATMAFGMEALAKQPDLLVLGSIAVGDQASCAAIAQGLFGGEPGDWTDDEAGRAAQAAARLGAEADGSAGPLELLRQFGGREIAAMAGAILAARNQGVPVLLDGYGAAAAAAVLRAVDPRATEHVMAGDVSPGPGHARLLARLGLEPVVTLGMSEGEGCGAAAAVAVVRLACDAVSV
jgi:nicotinate-nucleotide--dimethylbenzimidazole phosphoribosyltransferase